MFRWSRRRIRQGDVGSSDVSSLEMVALVIGRRVEVKDLCGEMKALAAVSAPRSDIMWWMDANAIIVAR